MTFQIGGIFICMTNNELKQFIIRRAQTIEDLLDGWMVNTGSSDICGYISRDNLIYRISEEIGLEIDDSIVGSELGFWNIQTQRLIDGIEWYLKTYLNDEILDWYDNICD